MSHITQLLLAGLTAVIAAGIVVGLIGLVACLHSHKNDHDAEGY